MLYQYLKENYIPGEPIFTGDISIPGMTEENLRYHLKKLTESGIICRFEPGVYYTQAIHWQTAWVYPRRFHLHRR